MSGPTCEKTFVKEKAMKEHNIAVHNEAKYVCSNCERLFKTSSALRRHQKMVPRKCDICDIKFCTAREKMNHYKVVHQDDMPFKCKSCPKKFPNNSEMELHIGTEHSKGENTVKVLKCDQCDFKTIGKMAKYRLKTHSFVHKEKPHPCEECGNRFVSNHSLELHRKSIHLGLKEFSCNDCNQAYTQRGGLKRHIEIVHSNQKQIRPYSCDICGKTFKRKYQRNVHYREVHTNKESFQCEHCGKSFSVKITLREHKLLHHSDREKFGQLYYCGVCDFKTARKQTLENHGFKHLDQEEKPHACEHCEKRYVQNFQLQGHIKSVHLGIKEFKCDHCENSFINSSSLKRHLKRTHDLEQ